MRVPPRWQYGARLSTIGDGPFPEVVVLPSAGGPPARSPQATLLEVFLGRCWRRGCQRRAPQFPAVRRNMVTAAFGSFCRAALSLRLR